jgi:hypothetical protein
MLSFIDALLRGQAQHATFYRQKFIKAWFCWGEMCLFCHMAIVGWLEIMIHHTASIVCDFHFPVDFRLDVLFPHILWFLHQNWVGIGGFTQTKLRNVVDEEKTIPSCLDTSSPMIAPPVLPQSAFSALKKTDWPKLDRFKVLVLDVLSARRVSAELQLESQSEPMGSSGI